MLRRALPCLLALPLLPALAAAPPLLRSEGIARSAEGAVLYREVHWQRGAADGSERWVVYQCPDGTPFARKQMPASAQPQARGYQLQDARSGQRASVQVEHDAVVLDWQEQAGAAAQRAQLPLPADAVIDAGFDAAVRLHWAALLRGEAVSLPFLVPGRQRYYSVQVRRTGAVQWEGQPAQAMRVRLDAWYGAVAPSLSLVYADADRRLLEFRGTSNLRDAAGRYPPVVVRFAGAARSGEAAAWQRDLQQPLAPRCAAATA